MQPVPTVPELAQLGPFRGGLFIRARRMGGVAALVGMFLSPPSAQLDQLPRGNTALLRLPAVAVPRPWDVTLAANQPITVCPIG